MILFCLFFLLFGYEKMGGGYDFRIRDWVKVVGSWLGLRVFTVTYASNLVTVTKQEAEVL